jgi:hypothetical protein
MLLELNINYIKVPFKALNLLINKLCKHLHIHMIQILLWIILKVTQKLVNLNF